MSDTQHDLTVASALAFLAGEIATSSDFTFGGDCETGDMAHVFNALFDHRYETEDQGPLGMAITMLADCLAHGMKITDEGYVEGYLGDCPTENIVAVRKLLDGVIQRRALEVARAKRN